MFWNKSKLTALGSLSTLVLLLIYAASSLKVDSIHQLFHTEDITELHSAKKESDPCHKNIYHQQKESGCEHQSHVTENSKCPICETTANSEPAAVNFAAERISFHELITNSLNDGDVLSPCVNPNPNRGPPQV